jgi:hypothetical protein
LDGRILCFLLRMPEATAERLAAQSCFQSIWAEILRTSPRLGNRPILLRRLPFEIMQARFLVQLLRARSSINAYIPAGPGDNLSSYPAELLSQNGMTAE